MRISDWSSDVCSSDLRCRKRHRCLRPACFQEEDAKDIQAGHGKRQGSIQARTVMQEKRCPMPIDIRNEDRITESTGNVFTDLRFDDAEAQVLALRADLMRSEEHTSELQSLMRISYAVFCLKNTNNK